MKLLSTFVLLALASSLVSQVEAAEPVRLILDTDMGNDIDDVLALAMIHSLESRGEVQLLAVTISKDNRDAAPFVSLTNTFYGRPEIPVGVVHAGKTPEDSPFMKGPVYRTDGNGKPVYPRNIASGSQAPEAVQLLTRILSEQPDSSVTVVQIGFSTNLARLLDAPGGRALIEKKVKLLCLMAGNFAKPEPEYNVYIDPTAAEKLFAEWPTPMIFSPFDVGLVITYPGESIKRDFGYVQNHPVAEAYKIMLPDLKDRPNWDSTAALYAVRPDRGYFDLSQPGRVTLGPKSITIFHPESQGKCRYLIVKQDQVARVRELIAALASQPPEARLAAGQGPEK